MSRSSAYAVALAALLLLAACGKETPPAAEQPRLYGPDAAVSMPTADEERAADASAAVASCSRQCGDGVTATIQCPTGEAAVCNCDAEPRARCELLPTPGAPSNGLPAGTTMPPEADEASAAGESAPPAESPAAPN
ncbi:hypothetical protein E4T66_00760 [Sinimarinibacterium sp. CAU 1509]|uniref:hypothetical protein n=1 Tax=Sinimarinibacterium sp. CAU 1509 TaxID=2562283 RepID=UPI0010AB94BB|nr:hypothetical protein [Sinimarinibacterium sp. CAU 1509]TJY64806.1 hypothetical protein E4T66_00760 [Sinimarinibacterium sp. CAU 1509]